MENVYALPQIKTALMNEARILQELSNQAYHIELNIKRIARRIDEMENGLNARLVEKPKSNIIPFPNQALTNQRERKVRQNNIENVSFNVVEPIMAKPGEGISFSIPDFRNALQRNGLILLSWDKRINERGEFYTAYWVTSTGVCRYFASAPLKVNDFAFAQPDHKSYAAEDGIEFYGQSKPHYIVHVAPELMMNRRGSIDERPKQIEKLKELGIKTNFDYKFLLTREKKKFPNRRRIHRKKEA